MFVGRGAGRWVEASLVGNSCPHCLGYSVVDFKDNPFGAIFAVFSLILALHDGEGVHDVVHGMPWGRESLNQGFGLAAPLVLRPEVEVEEGGIQFAAE